MWFHWLELLRPAPLPPSAQKTFFELLHHMYLYFANLITTHRGFIGPSLGDENRRALAVLLFTYKLLFSFTFIGVSNSHFHRVVASVTFLFFTFFALQDPGCRAISNEGANKLQFIVDLVYVSTLAGYGRLVFTDPEDQDRIGNICVCGFLVAFIVYISMAWDTLPCLFQAGILMALYVFLCCVHRPRRWVMAIPIYFTLGCVIFTVLHYDYGKYVHFPEIKTNATNITVVT